MTDRYYSIAIVSVGRELCSLTNYGQCFQMTPFVTGLAGIWGHAGTFIDSKIYDSALKASLWEFGAITTSDGFDVRKGSMLASRKSHNDVRKEFVVFWGLRSGETSEHRIVFFV